MSISVGFPMKDLAVEGASASVGNVAKVVDMEGERVMIVSTCVVLGGNSGGPLLNQSGEILGIVTASVRTMQGKRMPRLNFSIPIETVLKVVHNPELLEKKNKKYEQLWALKGKQKWEEKIGRFGKMLSKL